MKIAIIGSGISGIGCAYFLNPHHDIILFEKNDYVGGHANTASIEYPTQNSFHKISVDTGFIVYNFKTYPNLKPFFEELKVPISKSLMSFGVSIKDGLEYCGQSIGGLFAQKRNLFKPQFLKMIFDIVKFNKAAIRVVKTNQFKDISLGNFIDNLNLGEYFKKYYLLPMSAAIWSCPVEIMKNYPAKTFLQFFYNHGLLTITNQPQWYTVEGGSKEYIKRAIIGFEDKIRLNCGVQSVFKNEDGTFTLIDDLNQKYQLDKVIFACHANDTLQILQDPSEKEKSILSKFKYSQNNAVLHRDFLQMPKNKKAWASWIYLSANQDNLVSLTYQMNNLQNIDRQFPLFVTLNPINKIDKKLIFGEYNYTHPIFDLEAIQAQKRLSEIQGTRGVYFCGAHFRYGFHEDGLWSALNVVNQFGIKAKWQY